MTVWWSRSARCARTDGTPQSSTVEVPQANSGQRRYVRSIAVNQDSSEPGSSCWAATLTFRRSEVAVDDGADELIGPGGDNAHQLAWRGQLMRRMNSKRVTSRSSPE